MQTPIATFWPLNGQLGWHTADSPPSQGVAVSKTSIRLTAVTDAHGQPTGPLSLTWLDDSLGGLTLARGMAFDMEGLLYLLSLRQPTILRFDPPLRRFVSLPGVGGEGQDARQFHQPANLAIAGHDLYVADRGNRRVQVFALIPALPLRHLWGPWDAAGRQIAADADDAWEPVDVTAQHGAAYILDGRHGRVYRHQPGTDRLTLVVTDPAAHNRWSRIAVDRAGRIYLLDHAAPRLQIFDPMGHYLGEVRDTGEVRDRFGIPAVRLYYRTPNDDPATGRFCLPPGLMRLCSRQAHATLAVESPLTPCLPLAQAQTAPSGLIFDREGRRAHFDPAEPVGPHLYASAGTWYSDQLDSGIYHCQWHRIELELATLPAGTQVVVSSYSTDAGPGPESPNSPLWTVDYTIAGQMQPPPSTGLTKIDPEQCTSYSPARDAHEFLIQSREGQYLWLKLELFGDGYSSPEIQALRIHYPRQSYLQYLPAIYAGDDSSRWFLERFLSIFQTEWDAIERQNEEISRLFDPGAVPPGPFLEELARWLALPLEGTWSSEQKRNLLKAAHTIYPQRGTSAGLRRYLQVYLQNIVGLTPDEQRAYPLIIEGFRERRRLMLSTQADLGLQSLLWGPKMVGRLQLDVFAQEGDVRLISTGDPERDLFHTYAHHFRVFVPAAWVRTAEDEQMVRRAVDAEKPLHTAYDLCLVEARFRIGVQATLGLDTIIGDYPTAQLTCTHETKEMPPSAAPRHRLGYDTILTGQPSAPLHLTPATRLGIETLLS